MIDSAHLGCKRKSAVTDNRTLGTLSATDDGDTFRGPYESTSRSPTQWPPFHRCSATLVEVSSELVIFDNDGVLVDSEPLSNSVMAVLLTEIGVPTTVEGSMGRFLGRSLAAVRRIVETEDGIPLPADFEERYTNRLHDLFATSLTVVPGMRRVVEAVARSGIAYCVASSGGHDKIRLTHELVGLADLFADVRFSADDVAHGKPEPDLFLHAAASMGVDPGACIVIEDSPAGVEAARRAGMGCIGFAARTDADTLGAATLGVVSHADDISPILGL